MTEEVCLGGRGLPGCPHPQGQAWWRWARCPTAGVCSGTCVSGSASSPCTGLAAGRASGFGTPCRRLQFTTNRCHTEGSYIGGARCESHPVACQYPLQSSNQANECPWFICILWLGHWASLPACTLPSWDRLQVSPHWIAVMEHGWMDYLFINFFKPACPLQGQGGPEPTPENKGSRQELIQNEAPDHCKEFTPFTHIHACG